LQEFGWVGARPSPPAQWDLRRAGWRLVRGGGTQGQGPTYPILVEHGLPGECLAELVGRERIILLGIDSSDARARLIAEGFADALASSVRLGELTARAARATALAECMPRRRELGAVTLDLFHRDAEVAGRWLGLFPREFELLWCLSERPGARLTRRQLLKDVWRLDHDPETNRVEVHVSRLRSKLAFAGVGDLIGTGPAGGYFLRRAAISPHFDGRARTFGAKSLAARPVSR
jgi:two-component system OmpR family response regulator